MKKFILLKNEEIGEGIRLLELEPEDGKPLDYHPGQFINLSLQKEGETIKRPYSIASSPDSKNLELCIKIIGGQFTSLLPPLKPGTEFTVEGPFGPKFYSPEQDFVLIAGGVGIVPMMSILRHRAKREGGNFILFYCASYLSQMPYLEELRQLSKSLKIKCIFTLTRESPAGWQFGTGRFSKEDYEKEIPSPEKFSYFACGKKEMVDAVRSDLHSLGADASRSHFEGWGV
jgi:ferredoxin-NADP reductase